VPELITPQAIETLLNWFLWVALALGVGLIILSLAMMATGRRSERLLLSGLAALALGVTINQIFTAILEGISLEEPYQFISTVIVATFLILSVFYFAIGNPERGGKTLLATVLVAGFFAMIPALQGIFSDSVSELSGSCIILIEDQKVSGLEVTGKVRMVYGSGTYNLHVNFGDGSSTSATIAQGEEYTFNHRYSEAGNYAITAKASNEKHSCSVVSGVTIEPPKSWIAPPIDSPGTVLGLGTIPLTYYYIVPEFDLKDSSTDWKIYSTTTAIAISILALVISLRLVSGFLSRNPEESLPDTLKDTMVVLALILLAPYLYQIFALICNRISEIPMKNVDVTAFFASAAILIATSIALGFFSSFFGTLGGFLTLSLIISNLVVFARIFLIKGIILLFPFLAILYLFHLTRGAAQHAITILIGLSIAGPVAAFVLAGLASSTGPLAGLIAPVFAYILFPYLLALAQGASPTAVGTGMFNVLAGGAKGAIKSIQLRRGQIQAPAPGGTGGTGGSGGAGGAGGRVIVAQGGSGGGAGSGGEAGSEGGAANPPSSPPPNSHLERAEARLRQIRNQYPSEQDATAEHPGEETASISGGEGSGEGETIAGETGSTESSVAIGGEAGGAEDGEAGGEARAANPPQNISFRDRLRLKYYNMRERIELARMRMRDAVLSIKAEIENRTPESVKNVARSFMGGIEIGSIAWGVRPAKIKPMGLSSSMEDTVNTIRRKRQELLSRYSTNREQNPEAGDGGDTRGAGDGGGANGREQ
jgi:PKD repeat protein